MQSLPFKFKRKQRGGGSDIGYALVGMQLVHTIMQFVHTMYYPQTAPNCLADIWLTALLLVLQEMQTRVCPSTLNNQILCPLHLYAIGALETTALDSGVNFNHS